MIQCKWVEDNLSDYIDKEIDSETCEQVDTHVACCDHCQAFLFNYRSMGVWMKASQPIANTDAIWDRIAVQLDTSSFSGTKGANSFGSPRGLFSRAQNVPWSPLLMTLAASIAVLLLVLRPFSERDPAGHGLVHNQHERVVDLRNILKLARTDPKQTIELLVDRYDGKEMGNEEAERVLEFKPSLFQTIPDGYKLVSTHVLNMPCCKCSAILCQREDGMGLIVLEHREDQPVWFGDAPSIQTQCGGKSCQIVEAAGHLAISWKNENRHFTLLGATDLTEVNRWIESSPR